MLGANGDAKDWGGRWEAEREVMGHFLGVVEFVGYSGAVYGAYIRVLGVRFIDESDRCFVVLSCH